MKNRVLAQTEEVVSALHYARHQATLLGKTLKLIPQSEGWSSGMLLFNDDKLLFKWEWNNSDISLSWHGLYKNYLLFTPTGLDSALAGSFNICPLNTSSVKGENISMNRLGRIRVEETEEMCNT